MATRASTKHATKRTVILMVGKTGYGKSATANVILGMDAFPESDSSDTCPTAPSSASSHRYGRVVTVVDGPGLMNTTKSSSENEVQDFSNEVGQAVQQCSEGINAIVFVQKYPIRATEEERATLRALKSVLGENVFRDFGIVVYTFGELFDMKYGNTKTFQSWLNDGASQPDSLLDEFNGRTILFRNKQGDETQVKELLCMIDSINENNDRYTCDIFRQANEQRENLVREKKAPQLQHDFQLKVDLIFSGLERAKQLSTLDGDARDVFQNLRSDTEALEKNLQKMDQASEIFKVRQSMLRSVRQTIDILEHALERTDAMKRALQTNQAMADEEARKKAEQDLKEAQMSASKAQNTLQEKKRTDWNYIAMAIGGAIVRWIFTAIRAFI